MNEHLRKISDFIQQDTTIAAEEKTALLKSVKDADRELEITSFKLDRTEKVKRTTAILLEETIEELEQKRKAVEAHNKELGTETALERVRTVAMSMNKADDLLSICETMFNELKKLGFNDLRNAMINIHYDDKNQLLNYDYSDEVGKTVTPFTYNTHPIVDNLIYHAKQSRENFTEMVYAGEELQQWRSYRKDNGEADDTRLDNANALYYYFYSIDTGAIGVSMFEVASEEQLAKLKRFRNVFDLAYKRYIDITTAEAQAKESQIQLALERVRARTMAMQKSDELKDVIRVVYDQLLQVNVPVEHAGFIVDYKERDDMHIWLADKHDIPSEIFVPYFDTPHWNSFIEAKANKVDCFTNLFNFEEKNAFYKQLFELFPVPEISKDYYFNCPGLAISTVLLDNVGLYIENFSGIPYSEEENNALMRFGKVFQQTYTRFLDLQKAEAQAREAQVENALEKVRSRTMAMQRSDELSEVSFVLDSQVRSLGIQTRGCAFNIYGEHESTEWFSSEMGSMPAYKTPREHLFLRYYEAGLAGIPMHIETFAGDNCIAHYEYLCTIPVMGDALRNMIAAGGSFPEKQTDHATYFKYGYILFITKEPAEEHYDIFIRFAKVFEQTYTRFLDLQRAEAQSREKEIELALERVRARTMAMQQSSDLADTASVLFQQIKDLGFETWSCGFCTWQPNDIVEVWMGADSGGLLPPMQIPYKEEPTHHDVYKASLTGETVHQKVWEGKALEAHYAFLKTIPSVATAIEQLETAGLSLPAIQCYHVGFFKQGYLLLITKETNSELYGLTKRFAKVFEQTYTRFLDLQKAEAQAKESQIEAALERVRSRTLAMQKSGELAETAAVLFRQLMNLGIAPHRLYIGIIKDDSGNSEFWVTDEDGTKISTAFKTNLNDNTTFLKMFQAWKGNKKSIVIDLQGEALDDYFKQLTKLGVPFQDGLRQQRRLQHVSYFSQGFIGLASSDEQPAETILLMERFAAVFNLTYTRFNDLKLAEAHAIQAEEDLIKLQTEKQRAEDALNDLQAAQKQLVQSEKMASLGELTAGIAHEIQNPLNFVNNFSEVSSELIEELKIERKKLQGERDEQLEEELLNDIQQNLEKINHHGKRADGIVKGMLQHSQASAGIKEATNINKLADEYLRLAYHGLRSKDKNFNATLKTDFDESIGNINIVPQDIGRVILNLCTNAFYAVNEKQKSVSSQGLTSFEKMSTLNVYEPTVSISTKKIDDKILITVKDNGSGIPSNIADKIFQPFFTTKPTGQGTGLGLSLSYDIVKAHGGELKVETKAGAGSAFSIQIPVSL